MNDLNKTPVEGDESLLKELIAYRSRKRGRDTYKITTKKGTETRHVL